MRASRLLSLLMLLQTRGRMSAPIIADALGVSVRTIYRDIDHLEASGVPVLVERGMAGGFTLLEGWRTRLTGLTAAEAQALSLCGLPGPAAQLGMGEAVRSAQLKLLAALPTDWLVEARRVSARFHLDPVAWYRSTAPVPLLGTISDAVWNARRLQIRYKSWKDIVLRTVDPLGLVLKAGEWYLVGRVGESHRTYRVSCVLEAAQTGEGFEQPGSFDLATYWEESLRRFERELYVGSATVRASPQGCKLLRDSSRAVAEALDRGGEVEQDGWLRVSIPIESIDHATRELLRCGTQVEVLEPRALRERIAQIAREIAAIHAAPGRPTAPRRAARRRPRRERSEP
jgi:predicted DNA-binding transcriptional regulator YafY